MSLDDGLTVNMHSSHSGHMWVCPLPCSTHYYFCLHRCLQTGLQHSIWYQLLPHLPIFSSNMKQIFLDLGLVCTRLISEICSVGIFWRISLCSDSDTAITKTANCLHSLILLVGNQSLKYSVLGCGDWSVWILRLWVCVCVFSCSLSHMLWIRLMFSYKTRGPLMGDCFPYNCSETPF